MIGKVVLHADHVSKMYGSTRAVHDVSLQLRSGEIIGLVGENGSGKSTLLRLLAGVEPPDSGTIGTDQVGVPSRGLAHSAKLGVGVVFQELALIPNLRVFENFFLLAPQLNYGFGFLRSAWLRKASRQAYARYGLECDPDAFVADLPFDQRQMLEIARALELPRMLGADRSVLLLDEPTTALSFTGVERLLQILHSARDSQTAIVFVSHRLVENLSLADRLLVLRDGELVAERPPRGTTEKELHKLMVGRDRSEDYYHGNLRGELQNERVLDLIDLSGDGFHRVRLSVCAGEIVGIAGLASSGKSELCEAIHGLRRTTSGEVRVCGKDMTGKSVEARVARGVAFVPKERLAAGIIESASIRSSVGLQLLKRRFFVDRTAESLAAVKVMDRLRVKADSVETPLMSLSGGNQQKVALGKWMVNEPRLWVLDNPTRGVDVGARAEIYSAIRGAAAAGAGALLASDEISELAGMCDRIVAMRDGEIRAEIEPALPQWGQGELEREIIRHMV